MMMLSRKESGRFMMALYSNERATQTEAGLLPKHVSITIFLIHVPKRQYQRCQGNGVKAIERTKQLN